MYCGVAAGKPLVAAKLGDRRIAALPTDSNLLATVKLTSPIILILSVVVTAIVLMIPVVPLGVPGEWTWQRNRVWTDFAAAADRILPALIGGAILYGVAVRGGRRIARAKLLQTCFAYLLLILAAWFWLDRVQQTAHVEHRETKPYWVLYDPSSAGYFHEAAFQINSTSEFLRGYEDRMKEGEVLHVGTHPPGLFLLSQACLDVCSWSPTLVSWLNGLEDDRVRRAFRTIESGARFGPRLKSDELAALHLLSAISSFAVCLTIIPLAILGRYLFGATTAWWICCLWPTLPCLAVFLPKSDLLFPFTCTSVLALSVLATDRWRLFVLAVPAGIVLWCGMMLSLAHLPVIVVLAAFVAIRAWQTQGASLRLGLCVIGTVVVTVCAVSILWSSCAGCNIFSVWMMNFTNHAGFYDQFPRTYWKWLLVNPIELAFSVGLPVFALAVYGMITAVLRIFRTGTPQARRGTAIAFCLAAGATMDVLWLSGKNQGEVARLWCFLTPWLLLSAGLSISDLKDTTTNSASDARTWRTLLLAQIVVAAVTVSGVSGFSF
ncbi:MAG TPA: hypothetical protein EYQ63_17620 [Fuerstia sp.]|nr:hypothetical protein [Fuerstiella sp.]